jgi:hypothetical protein
MDNHMDFLDHCQAAFIFQRSEHEGTKDLGAKYEYGLEQIETSRKGNSNTKNRYLLSLDF